LAAGEHTYDDHVFIEENGSIEKLLTYEEGPQFDPANPFNPAFSETNRIYPAAELTFAPDGRRIIPSSVINPALNTPPIARGAADAARSNQRRNGLPPHRNTSIRKSLPAACWSPTWRC